MPVTFKGVTFVNNVVGISAPPGAKLTFDGAHFEGNGTGILIRDPDSLCDELGLSRSIDLKALKDILEEFSQKNTTAPAVEAELRGGRMKGWLATGADLVQVAQGIAGAVATPAFMALVHHVLVGSS